MDYTQIIGFTAAAYNYRRQCAASHKNYQNEIYQRDFFLELRHFIFGEYLLDSLRHHAWRFTDYHFKLYFVPVMRNYLGYENFFKTPRK
jgi:hypothetical protein